LKLIPLLQVPETMANELCVANIQGLEQTRALVASLEAGLQFSSCIAGTMDVLKQLLASSPDDVKHTIALLIIAQQFEIDGAEASLRKMLPLVSTVHQKRILALPVGVHTPGSCSRTTYIWLSVCLSSLQGW
jgi:condensin complex subunit 1